MASPCEILVRCNRQGEAEELASLAFMETKRIEVKFSRYRDDNLVYAINHSDGQAITLDAETSQLLQYASQCYDLSDGLFDITSGILRRAWKFDGQEISPDTNLISSLRGLVGWGKVEFDGIHVKLLPGMEIDLGGLGKEYAVDQVAQLLYENSHFPLMANFGGDIRALDLSGKHEPWHIGIENPYLEGGSAGAIQLRQGAVTTSGDSRRFCFVEGQRLGHILDPRTGWPVGGAPRSVTVMADFCMEAGLLSTMAMLKGKDAEAFLTEQGVKYYCIR
jgi:FAD:protein FMN transferase